MITVKEMLNYAIKTDLSYLAHGIYWAIKGGFIEGKDNSEKLKLIEFNVDAITKLQEENVLGVYKIKLFVVKTSNEGWYAFYFAENTAEVKRIHYEKFREKHIQITEAGRLMPNLMVYADNGIEASLYECRDGYASFPVYAGHVFSNQNVLYRFDEVSNKKFFTTRKASTSMSRT